MKRWWRWLAVLAAVPIALVGLFFLAAWIGSSIPRNSGWTEPADGIPIMVETNGVHTGIVMPVYSPVKDWRETFPSAGEAGYDGRIATHIAISWGEKEVFLNTPTWGDLKASTVMRIVLHGGEGLMRVARYVHPAPSEYHRPIRLRPDEYARLVAQIEAALLPISPGQPRYSYDSYEIGAHNYDALGRYTLTNTCNQWIGDVLANAGIKMGLWTPLSGGVMKWIPEPSARHTAAIAAR